MARKDFIVCVAATGAGCFGAHDAQSDILPLSFCAFSALNSLVTTSAVHHGSPVGKLHSLHSSAFWNFFFFPGCRLNSACALLPVIFCLSMTHTQTLLVSSFIHLGPCLVFGNPLPWELNHPRHFHHLCTHALVSPSLFFLSPQGRLLRPLKGDLLYDSIVIELGHIWLADSHLRRLKTTPKRLDLVC